MSIDLAPPPLASPHHDAPPSASVAERMITVLIVAAPFLVLAYAVVTFWNSGIHVHDLVIGLALFVVIGHGISIGYHRLFAHKSFVARRPLKLALLAAGSMAFEGGPIGWVADHRRHHVFSDQPGDPHSPHRYGAGIGGLVRGLWHAHVGWLFTHEPTPRSRYTADLEADRDVVRMDSLFPLWCAVSLAVPFTLGWLVGGGVGAALTTLLWAGGVRIFLLHHVTWSVNSICHVFGRRPFVTTDRSSNVAALALVTMGESWHNGHHAFPRSARHGLLPHQWDSSARIIRTFEVLHWAHDVHWPTAAAITHRSVGAGPRLRS